MEKENFLGKLRKLVELAKSKQNALDVTEINNFFMGDNLQTEQMEQIYNYLEQSLHNPGQPAKPASQGNGRCVCTAE